MVAPRLKSRTLRRIKVRLPGSKTVTHYKRRKPSIAKCRKCKANLKGIPHPLQSIFKNLPKTAKRPQRPFGGELCTKCMRAHFVEKARKSE
ncbi:MAG: 50S ribosomal protein L34e [Nanoarchaeota archaeon]|nr:50S ribosomal protein L34e [Nanoarchaeota archaeon]